MMAEVYFSYRALTDLERVLDFLEQQSPALAIEAADHIVDGTRVLQRHPLIGRPVGSLHELIISKGRAGYVALYRYLPEKNQVEILAVRHQRESGWIE